MPKVKAQVFERGGVWDQDDWLAEFLGLLCVPQKDRELAALFQTSEQ